MAAPRRSRGSAEQPVVLGEWPRLEAQVLRRRLETAGIGPVTLEPVESDAGSTRAQLLVPAGSAEFASAVVNELDVDDEIPDTSPLAYVARIEELLSAAAGLLDELRTRLDELDRDDRA